MISPSEKRTQEILELLGHIDRKVQALHDRLDKMVLKQIVDEVLKVEEIVTADGYRYVWNNQEFLRKEDVPGYVNTTPDADAKQDENVLNGRPFPKLENGGL